MKQARDYGWQGRLGLGTPQGNPTVEAEMRRLVPAGVECYTLRLTSDSDDPATRLRHYLEQLPSFMSQYATLKPDAFMFACTGSSYLLPPDRVQECRDAAARALGAPVILAADAIHDWLVARGARRLLLLTPYPEWLDQPAQAYWRGRGFTIADSLRVEIGGADTYGIYEQQSPAVEPLLGRIGAAQADAVLVSGTGMPSLPVLRALGAAGRLAVSSNLALAQAGLAVLGAEATPPDSWWWNTGGT